MPRQEGQICRGSGTSTESHPTTTCNGAGGHARAPAEYRRFRCGHGSDCNRSGTQRASVRGRADSRQHLVKHVHPGMFGPGARFSLVTEPAPSTARDCRRRDLHPVAARTFAVSYWAAVRWAFAESGSEKMMIADVPLPPKKPDTTPDVVATYCLPPIS